MMERIAETSPRFKARMAGVCQLMEAVTAALGELIIPGKLVVAGNAVRLRRPISWDTSDYFGWGSYSRSSALRSISHSTLRDSQASKSGPCLARSILEARMGVDVGSDDPQSF